MTVTVSLVDGWTHLLQLCRVHAQECAVLLVGDSSHVDHVGAARMALARMGVSTAILQLGEKLSARREGQPVALGPTALAGNGPAVAAMKSADIVIDLFGMYRGAEQRDIQASGTRVILVKEPPETFLRLLPDIADKERAEAARALIERSKTMRATSRSGTDLRVSLGEFPVLMQYGFADVPGRWDHCPSTFAATWPNELSAEGTVVLAPGDSILPFKTYVRTPITLTIRGGFIRSIEGGGMDAQYLREYMASFNDPEGYAVAHLGWGLSRKALWTSLGMFDKVHTNGMEARSFAGNFMFSTGQNADIGGTRHTACHLDIPMAECSVFLDDVQVVKDGTVLA